MIDEALRQRAANLVVQAIEAALRETAAEAELWGHECGLREAIMLIRGCDLDSSKRSRLAMIVPELKVQSLERRVTTIIAEREKLEAIR